jgi:hypothetical protein
VKRKRKALLALGVVCAGVIAAGGTAFTNSNSLPISTTAGYGSTEVTGATVLWLTYHTNSTGTEITDATMKLLGDYSSGYTVKAGFGTNALSNCNIGIFNWDGTNLNTIVTCPFTQPTDDVQSSSFHVLVTNGTSTVVP